MKGKDRNRIPRKKIELKPKDRGDPSKVGAIVETGLNIEILKCGVSIIDSPGRNENKVLDNLVIKQLENPLAFIIYMVDGHNLFTKQARFLLSIRSIPRLVTICILGCIKIVTIPSAVFCESLGLYL